MPLNLKWLLGFFYDVVFPVSCFIESFKKVPDFYVGIQALPYPYPTTAATAHEHQQCGVHQLLYFYLDAVHNGIAAYVMLLFVGTT